MSVQLWTIYSQIATVAAEYIDACYTHEHHALNTSDRLPISCELVIPHEVHSFGENKGTVLNINWDKALASGECKIYQGHISQVITRVLGTSHSNAKEMNKEIKYISRAIQEVALSTLPLHKSARKQRKWYRDATLSTLCKQKKRCLG